MLVCLVCKYSHQKEVEKCQRCNWSMQDNLDINTEHPVLQICVSTLVKKLEEATKNNKHLQSMILQLEIKESDSRKLDEIIDELDKDRKEIQNQFASLHEQIDRLRTPLLEKKAESTELKLDLEEPKLVNSNAEANKKIDSYSDSSSDRQDIEHKASNKHLVKSDRKVDVTLGSTIKEYNNETLFNNKDNIVDDYQSGRNLSIYNSLGDKTLQDSMSRELIDHESSIDRIFKKHIEIETESNNYQNFYTLIDKKELDYINVAIPKETLEQSRSVTQSQLKFTKDRKGSYWIVNWENTYCLIPKKNINVDRYKYGNFQRVFNCSDYREDYSNFELIEPATITNFDGESWQLCQKGKIKFI